MQASSQLAGVDRPAQAPNSIMKTVKVVLNIAGESAAHICTLGKQALANMTSNPKFPSPFPPLADVGADITNLDSAITAAQNGGKTQLADLKAKKQKAITTLKALGAYVEYAADGDEQAILSSGFGVKKDRSPAAKTFMVKQGSVSGVAELVTKSAGTAAYLWQYTKDPIGSAGWTDAGVTVYAHHTVIGLTPLTTYWFRVALVTKDGLQNWSDPYHLAVI